MTFSRHFVPGLLASSLFLSPLFSPYLLNPNIVPFYSIPAFALAAYLICILTGSYRYQNIPLTLTLIFFLSIPVLLGSQQLLFAFTLLVMASVGASVARDIHEAIYKAFLASSAVIGLVSLYVWFGYTGGNALHFGDWALTLDRSRSKMNGPFANGNILAIVLVCAWVFSVYFWANSRSGKRWTWLTIIFCFWVLIFCTQAKGAWTAQAIIIVSLILAPLWKPRKKELGSLLLAGMLSAALGNWIYNQNINKITEQAHGAPLVQTASHSLAQRITIWKSSWEMWRANPVLGVGSGNFKAHYLTSQARTLEKNPEMPSMGATDNAHSVFFHLLAEHGLAGLALWLVVSGLLLMLLPRYIQNLHDTRWPAYISALVLWLQGHVNISLGFPYPLILFSLFTGIAAKPLLSRWTIRVKSWVCVLPATLVLGLLIQWAYLSTVHWKEFETWLSLPAGSKDKGRLARTLAEDVEVMPFVVESMARDATNSPDPGPRLIAIRPLILQALSLRETPNLFRALFLSYYLEGDWDNACKWEKFIKLQHWKEWPKFPNSLRITCSKPEETKKQSSHPGPSGVGHPRLGLHEPLS
ncbi:MAG: O-antigen ligase family protein [Bacteroidetes bacterium]|nr:MAG: O-antigen ligase family protein [Bacteroidota bacterium]